MQLPPLLSQILLEILVTIILCGNEEHSMEIREVHKTCLLLGEVTQKNIQKLYGHSLRDKKGKVSHRKTHYFDG